MSNNSSSSLVRLLYGVDGEKMILQKECCKLREKGNMATTSFNEDDFDEELKKKEAKELFERSIEEIEEDDVGTAASSGQRKIEKLAERIPQQLQALWEDVQLLVSLLHDYATGVYRKIPFASIASVAAAIIYFVSPFDAIPDFIPVVGYLDDAAVLALYLRMVRADIDDYREWKNAKKIEKT